MNPPIAWTAQCPHCKERFPIDEAEAHRAGCEARNKELFQTQVERPRTWSFDVAFVREVYSDTPGGRVRKFFAATSDQLVTRAQLVAFRDLITLALGEAPDPLPVQPAVPAPPPPPTTGAA